MGDNELLKDFSPCGIMLQTFAQQVNLEVPIQDLFAKMSKPWFIDVNGAICVDEAMSKDDLDRLAAKGVPVFSSNGILLRTNITAEDLFALRIKRNKKHYKPKFTL